MHHGRSGHKLAALLLCALPLLTGCLDYGEELTIDEKGGGSLRIDFVADMNFMSEVAKAIGDEPRPEEMRGPTKEEIQQGLQVEGIKLKELDVEDKGGKTKVHIALDFTSIDALKKIEGFGDDRTIEFFDEGNGKVRVVYSFDTSDLVPVEETGEPGAQEDPTEKKIREITQRARDQVKFRAKVKLPGPIERNNGKAVEGDPNAAQWRVDKESDPQRHATFGRGKVRMMMLVARARLPFLKDGDLKPLPPKREGSTEASPPGGNPSGPPGLGD